MAYKKGNIPWNKGSKGLVKANSGSFMSMKNIGRLNNEWKGDNVGYHALHEWVYKWKGKPNKCEKCGNKNKVQWANKNHRYKRNLNDWVELCYWCHRKYDGISKISKQDVDMIRKMYQKGSRQIDLAKKYKVSDSSIYRIVTLRTYNY